MNGIKSVEVATKKGRPIAVAAYEKNPENTWQAYRVYVRGSNENVYEMDQRIGINTGGFNEIATALREGCIVPEMIGRLLINDETQPIADALGMKPKEFARRYPGIEVTENKG